ncbi:MULTISPECIES: C40 family peptidase [Flammeovirga]|uniref:NlpC/P60 family protein n=1 Tax=Flammeovirga agarivorans TaxID=2726742 RepID=A0A7X8SJD0_9BACT|nr:MULTISPECIES: NlpC/P60 family protein [Flammeovirga]NLR91212.1 NlpC/P60 family protein [Flammeovirga agarivorans]
MKINKLYITLTLGFFTLFFQSCQFGKQYTYTTRQDRIQDVEQKQLQEIGYQSNANTNTASVTTEDNVPTMTTTDDIVKTLSAKGKAEVALKTAHSYKGVRYQIGGTTKKGMDCSGLMLVSWQAANVELPRTSQQQAKTGKYVPFASLKPGDLVFFSGPGTNSIKHVGMISKVVNGKNYFIHASSHGVREDEISEVYWKKYYKLGRRVD